MLVIASYLITTPSASSQWEVALSKEIFRWVEFALHGFLLYLLVISWVLLFKWQVCIWRSVDAIQDNPGFTQRLRGYAEFASQWKTLTNMITVIEPLTTTIETIKLNGLWDGIVDLANLMRPGAGDALQALDEFVSKTVEVKNQLLSLSRLASSAEVVERHFVEPTHISQRDLFTIFVDNAQDISALVDDLKAATRLVDSVSASLEVMTNGLDRARAYDILGMVEQLYQIIAPLESNMRNSANNFAEFTTSFAADSNTIDVIVTNTQKVERIYAIVPNWLRPVVDTIVDHMLLTALLALTYVRIRMVFLYKTSKRT